MKLEPKSQTVPIGKRPDQRRGLVHAAGEKEMDTERVRTRANQVSGVLNGILNRHDSPEHISLKQ